MDIIITHEQADFDAIASVLAGWLLEPKRFPVHPKRMNRNVTAFISEYKDDFPFKGWEELPEEKLNSILLVDTQSLGNTSLIEPETMITVIDHHQPRANLPESWKCRFDRMGACTSMMVESIRVKKIFPEPIHCSLLLMGIYEDTGNLTYGSTTPRDLEAAAWLIGQGADLNILRRFLNSPMTEAQDTLCDRLLQQCENLSIMGQQIILTSADARDISDEFSTVAHHLRDMLSPDAIFVVLATRAGIRLIGRATNDRIDVGQIMKRFNGGGHSRAAAGLIPFDKNQEILDLLASTIKELLDMLPGFITPPITVEQIMSTRPLTISSDTSIRDVAELIRRYGYEGYPITDANGKLIGLLNRRSVDRAIAFDLDPSIETIMEPGDYTVKTNDPIDFLKEMMNLSGWGQIPVVSEQNSEIVGIVTRTDLIKTLSGTSSIPGNKNYAQTLSRVLPPSYLTLIKMVAQAAYSCNFPIYIVGGFVRDLILEQPVMDFDIVVEGDAIHLARTLVNIYGGTIRTHSRFGTAKWIVGSIHSDILSSTGESGNTDSIAALPETLDLISARTEFYDYPSAMPKVERSSIKLDLHRRDFTINTMAIRLDGEHFGDLLDYWGGYNDLQRELIRVLHSLSFTDDPTRMLRAIRFEQRFGFTIEKHTMLLLKEAQTLLKQVSGRRILNEIDLFFNESSPEISLNRLEKLGLLSHIHPAIHWNDRCTKDYRKIIAASPANYWKEIIPDHSEFIRNNGKYLIWWGTYSPDVIAEICKRLQLPQITEKALAAASLLNRKLPEISIAWPSEITSFLEKLPVEAIYYYDCLTDNLKMREVIRKFITKWQYIKPYTNGTDLKALSYPPGDWISATLKRLRNAWIDEEISSREEEMKTLDFILPIFTKNLEKKQEKKQENLSEL
ncbi:MAG: CBS domain-containing protein [Flexilinea sp.]